MRTCTLLLAALLSGTAAMAQTVATFDTMHLSKADTFYVNYTSSGNDVGFDDGHAHFPCIYNSSFGGYWETGFAYSNMTDSVTSGFMNQYSAKAGSGYGGSSTYLVGYCSDPVTYENKMRIILNGTAVGKPVKGFYATNSTYTYNSMRDGDGFAKKFGNGDWFLLTVQGYSGGMLQPTKVGVYLADFLFPDPTQNYILNKWQWVDLLPLGNVDSLQLSLSSSDNGMYGMNTPAYFCIDNFTTYEPLPAPSLSVNNITTAVARVYPNPAKDMLYIEPADKTIKEISICDLSGSVVYKTKDITMPTEINTSQLAAGMYLLKFAGDKGIATSRFIKN